MNWISVSQKMPPTYEIVLVRGEHGEDSQEPVGIAMAQWDGKEWVLLIDIGSNAAAHRDIWWQIETEEITHWIQLPWELYSEVRND